MATTSPAHDFDVSPLRRRFQISISGATMEAEPELHAALVRHLRPVLPTGDLGITSTPLISTRTSIAMWSDTLTEGMRAPLEEALRRIASETGSASLLISADTDDFATMIASYETVSIVRDGDRLTIEHVAPNHARTFANEDVSA